MIDREQTIEQRTAAAMPTEQSQADAYTRSWTDFIHRCIDQRGQLISKEYLDEFIHMYTDVLAAEVGRIEKNIRADLTLKQDSEAAALRVELATLRSQVVELVDIVSGLAADVAELQADIGDVVNRKVMPLKRRRNAAA